MSMFNAPGQQSAPVDDDALEGPRRSIQRHPVLKWQYVGSYIELATVDYNDQAAVKEGGQQKVRHFNDGTSKAVTQDVLTGLVIAGNTLVTPVEDPNRLDEVVPDLIVTQFISGHNRWSPQRPQGQGLSWRDAKEALNRGLITGDLIRIDYVAFEETASDGRKLQNGKKVLAFQCRPLGGTPAELEILEKARAARRALKAAQQGPQTTAFRPVNPTAPQVPQPAQPADPTSSLFA